MSRFSQLSNLCSWAQSWIQSPFNVVLYRSNVDYQQQSVLHRASELETILNVKLLMVRIHLIEHAVIHLIPLKTDPSSTHSWCYYQNVVPESLYFSQLMQRLLKSGHVSGFVILLDKTNAPNSLSDDSSCPTSVTSKYFESSK